MSPCYVGHMSTSWWRRHPNAVQRVLEAVYYREMSPTPSNPLSNDDIATSATQIAAARASQSTLQTLVCPPQSDEEAYAIQQHVTDNSGRKIVGWKIGATSAFAQEFLGCAGPFSGPIFEGDVYESGAAVDAGALLNPMMEPEIAVVLQAPLGGDGAITAEAASEALGEVRPSVELVGGCFPDIAACGYRTVIADRGANLGVVLGAPVDAWRDIDLGAVPVALLKNGEVAGSGVGADALGGAMHALAWLATHLGKRGLRLQPGDIITTGTIGGVAPLAPGDRGEGTHGVLGGVEFTYG